MEPYSGSKKTFPNFRIYFECLGRTVHYHVNTCTVYKNYEGKVNRNDFRGKDQYTKRRIDLFEIHSSVTEKSQYINF